MCFTDGHIAGIIGNNLFNTWHFQLWTFRIQQTSFRRDNHEFVNLPKMGSMAPSSEASISLVGLISLKNPSGLFLAKDPKRWSKRSKATLFEWIDSTRICPTKSRSAMVKKNKNGLSSHIGSYYSLRSSIHSWDFYIWRFPEMGVPQNHPFLYFRL